MVFSTYVEVILARWTLSVTIVSFLHVCGGDPDWRIWCFCNVWFSPRMWRWSSSNLNHQFHQLVFSTYVEVILINPANSAISRGFLHVCGGDPIYLPCYQACILFSPRMWRWSSFRLLGCEWFVVFSTYVEVIPTNESEVLAAGSFLHVCGGDPSKIPFHKLCLAFSPRMWRWSLYDTSWIFPAMVFSTYVEVILRNWHIEAIS